MNWSPDFEDIVRDESTTKARGTSCYFVELTTRTGLKLYLTPYERDAAWVCQSIGAEHGIAPYVGECVELTGLDIPYDSAPHWWHESYKQKTPNTLYGFLTEIVEPCTDDEEPYELHETLSEMGFDNIGSDAYGGNLGHNEDGTLVLLDWDARFTTYGLLTTDEVDEIEAHYEPSSLWNRAG